MPLQRHEDTGHRDMTTPHLSLAARLIAAGFLFRLISSAHFHTRRKPILQRGRSAGLASVT